MDGIRHFTFSLQRPKEQTVKRTFVKRGIFIRRITLTEMVTMTKLTTLLRVIYEIFTFGLVVLYQYLELR